MGERGKRYFKRDSAGLGLLGTWAFGGVLSIRRRASSSLSLSVLVMKLSVLEQAKGRLKLAERAFASICSAGHNRTEFQTHWLDFLVQWKGTYTKVQQAAKDSAQEIQWFGSVNRERRNDPLLRYLFEARNDGEHNTEQSATHKPDRFTFSSEGAELKVRVNDDGSLYIGQDGRPSILDEDGPISDISLLPAESRLLPVKEFDGKRIVPPPTSHLDKPMEPIPLNAANLGLVWLSSLVATAEAMSDT